MQKLFNLVGLEPTTFELEVQCANPLRHRDYMCLIHIKYSYMYYRYWHNNYVLFKKFSAQAYAYIKQLTMSLGTNMHTYTYVPDFNCVFY